MIWFICRRLGWALATVWVVFTVAFFLMHSVPGGPFDKARRLPPQVEANLKQRYGLDDPVPIQYFRELNRYLHFDFGYSYQMSDFTVNEVIAEGFPKSATLGILAMALAVGLGFAAGVVSAVYRGGLADFTLMSIATVGIALPSFVIAGLAIILFAFVWPLFPPAGFGSVSQVVLPALCLGAAYAAEIARLVRTGMLDVMNQDYIRTAYAKGLRTPAVILRHALKGGILPVVSYLGPATSGIITGSVVIETIFAIPGLGFHFVQSALQRDYTLAMGLIVLDTSLLCLANLIVDVLYTVLDPRVKVE